MAPLATQCSSQASTWSISVPATRAGPSSPSPFPSLASVCSTRVFTLPHIPKGARDAWAGIFSQELKATCSSPRDPAKWSCLFMLPKCILLIPTVSSRSDWRVTLHLVMERLRLWVFWDAVLEEAGRISGNTASGLSVAEANVRQSKRALEDGQYRKAIYSDPFASRPRLGMIRHFNLSWTSIPRLIGGCRI